MTAARWQIRIVIHKTCRILLLAEAASFKSSLRRLLKIVHTIVYAGLLWIDLRTICWSEFVRVSCSLERLVEATLTKLIFLIGHDTTWIQDWACVLIFAALLARTVVLARHIVCWTRWASTSTSASATAYSFTSTSLLLCLRECSSIIASHIATTIIYVLQLWWAECIYSRIGRLSERSLLCCNFTLHCWSEATIIWFSKLRFSVSSRILWLHFMAEGTLTWMRQLFKWFCRLLANDAIVIHTIIEVACKVAVDFVSVCSGSSCSSAHRFCCCRRLLRRSESTWLLIDALDTRILL